MAGPLGDVNSHHYYLAIFNLTDFFRPLRVISSICCTRVLLNIRAAYFRPGTTTEFEIIQGVTRSTGGWRSSNIASDTTAVPSDMEHGEKGGRGWTWEEAKSPRLSLGRMSPFLYDVPEIPEEVE